MKLWTCLRFHLLQIWRSRLVVMWTLFSLFLQYGVASLLRSATVEYQHAQTFLGLREVVFALIYSQVIAGTVLATVYGIWIVPYLHEGSRAPLTYALPVNKTVFPLTYFVGFLLLYLIQVIATGVSLSIQFGFSAWTDAAFPWKEFISGTVLSAVALEVTALFLGVISLVFGKMGAFIGGTAFLMVLQVSGGIFRAGLGLDGLWRKIYVVMPPIGEIFFDLKDGLLWQGVQLQHFLLWTVWLVLLAVLLRVRLSRA